MIHDAMESIIYGMCAVAFTGVVAVVWAAVKSFCRRCLNEIEKE